MEIRKSGFRFLLIFYTWSGTKVLRLSFSMDYKYYLFLEKKKNEQEPRYLSNIRSEGFNTVYPFNTQEIKLITLKLVIL